MIDETDDDNEEAMQARFDEIRKRFVASLPDRLAIASKALPQVEGDNETAAVAVASLYGAVHEMCGLAPMLGFASLGPAARAIDNALVAAFRAKRGLTRGEAGHIPPLLEILQVSSKQCESMQSLT